LRSRRRSFIYSPEIFVAKRACPHDITCRERRKSRHSNKSTSAGLSDQLDQFRSQLRLQKLQDGCFAVSKIDCLALERFVGLVFQIFDDISVEVTWEHNRIDVTLSTNCRSVSELGYLADCIFDVCFGLRSGMSGNRFGRLNARSDN
jgi:hypothetical protein